MLLRPDSGELPVKCVQGPQPAPPRSPRSDDSLAHESGATSKHPALKAAKERLRSRLPYCEGPKTTLHLSASKSFNHTPRSTHHTGGAARGGGGSAPQVSSQRSVPPLRGALGMLARGSQAAVQSAREARRMAASLVSSAVRDTPSQRLTAFSRGNNPRFDVNRGHADNSPPADLRWALNACSEGSLPGAVPQLSQADGLKLKRRGTRIVSNGGGGGGGSEKSVRLEDEGQGSTQKRRGTAHGLRQTSGGGSAKARRRSSAAEEAYSRASLRRRSGSMVGVSEEDQLQDGQDRAASSGDAASCAGPPACPKKRGDLVGCWWSAWYRPSMHQLRRRGCMSGPKTSYNMPEIQQLALSSLSDTTGGGSSKELRRVFSLLSMPRTRMVDRPGMPRDFFKRALEALNLGFVDEGLVLQVLFDIPGTNDLDFSHFSAAVADFNHRSWEQVKEEFTRLDCGCKGHISRGAFRFILEGMGFKMPVPHFDDLLQEVGVHRRRENVTWREIEDSVAVLFERAGFTKAQLERIDNLYATYDPHGRDRMNVYELGSGLGNLGMPTSVQEARRIVRELDLAALVRERSRDPRRLATPNFNSTSDSSSSDESSEEDVTDNGSDDSGSEMHDANESKRQSRASSTMDGGIKDTVTRQEFLTVVRQRMDTDAFRYLRLFAEADQDRDCLLHPKELMKVLSGLGYSIPALSDVQELIKVALPWFMDTKTGSARLSLRYEEALTVVNEVRVRQGFLVDELRLFIRGFARFDPAHKGEIPSYDCSRALTWLGYPIPRRKLQLIFCRSSLIRNGSVEDAEFLRVLRLLREEEIQGARALLKPTLLGSPRAWLEAFESFVESLGFRWDGSFKEVLKASEILLDVDMYRPVVASLPCIADAVRRVRSDQLERLRHGSYLPLTVQSAAETQFKKLCEAGTGMSVSELLRFVQEQTADCRVGPSDVFEADELRTLAMQECAIQEHPVTSCNVSFETVRQFVRRCRDIAEERFWNRQDEIMRSCILGETEKAKLREAFLMVDETMQNWLSPEDAEQALALASGEEVDADAAAEAQHHSEPSAVTAASADSGTKRRLYLQDFFNLAQERDFELRFQGPRRFQQKARRPSNVIL